MKDKLIIAGVVIAIVFTFLGYSQTKQLSQKLAALERDVASLLKTQESKQVSEKVGTLERKVETLKKETEKLDKDILASKEAIPIIEKLTESLIKIIEASKSEQGKK